MKTRLTIINICFLLNILSQEFYINKDSKLIVIDNEISSEWTELNFNESEEFLKNLGFHITSIEKKGDKTIVVGEIRQDNYVLTRDLVFKNDLILEYIDKMSFMVPCLSCLANKLKSQLKGDDLNDLKKMYENEYNTYKNKEKLIIDQFIYNSKIYFQKDNCIKDVNSNLFFTEYTDSRFYTSVLAKNNDSKIIRNIEMNILENTVYQFKSYKKVEIISKEYYVNQHNLKEVNFYDLKLMVDIFLQDCKLNNIIVPNSEVSATFEVLDSKTLGLSYAIYNDKKIILKIDPEKWVEASMPKRWYLIYHELGHDVLNLEHGNGGKMMFSFADKGYSWEEFWQDRDYMFQFYKNSKK